MTSHIRIPRLLQGLQHFKNQPKKKVSSILWLLDTKQKQILIKHILDVLIFSQNIQFKQKIEI